MALITLFLVNPCNNIETNKHPTKKIYIGTLGIYWNKYGILCSDFAPWLILYHLFRGLHVIILVQLLEVNPGETDDRTVKLLVRIKVG